MGGTFSQTPPTYVHVLNCSNRAFWIRDEQEWAQVAVTLDVQTYAMSVGQKLELLNEAKEDVLQEHPYTVGLNDVLVYFSSKGRPHVVAWPVHSEYQRPTYVIAHRCNHPDILHQAVKDGANSVEIDVVYHETSRTWYVNHDAPEGYTLQKWLTEAHPHALPMLIIDVKTPCPTERLRQILRVIRRVKYHYPVTLSVATELDCLAPLVSELHSNEGVATDFLSADVNLVSQLPKNSNVWFGNGIDSRLRKVGLYADIRRAVALRNNGQTLKKVYVWCFDTATSFLRFLHADVDGIMVEPDFVKEAAGLVKRNPFVRMASLRDPPFQKSQINCKAMLHRARVKR